MDHPVDRLFGSLFYSLFVALVTIFVFCQLSSAVHADMSDLTRIAIPLAISACVVFPRPLLLRTVLRSRQSPFVSDSHLNNMLVGRALGLAGGLIAAGWVMSLFI